MLGSVSEAEDVVQEAMIRLHATDPAQVRSPTAYAAT
jgi:DNA-directed RNA polymerase specialized sigma24 family protein